MFKDVVKVAGSAAAIPASAIGGALHRQATGTRAILELEVKPWEDVGARHQVLARLRRAAGDPGVAGLYLRISGPPGNWAASQDLRKVLRQLRNAGKSVYALLEAPGNAATWIASACDRVFLVPTGEVGLVGLGIEMTFLGEALDRLGIAADFEAAGAYKSFGEPWTRTFASRENREAVEALVADVHEQLVADVADGRALSVEQVREILTRAPLSAEDAVEAGLVDQLAYDDEARTWVEEHHGDKARFQEFSSWARRDLVLEWIEHWGDSGSKIAIVHLQGAIVMDDKSPSTMIRARHVVPVLRDLLEKDEVEAVVLHVNSPGGSALASDLIWREVERLGHEKPVIASFEDVAASGGYYLSAPAVEILARPGTLTGSIGVFGGKLVMSEAFRKLGVHTQEVQAAPNANLYSATRPFSDDQRQRFRSSLQRFYDTFVDKVASGRRIPAESIEPHCRGRVWTGRLAREHGLVDRHGDLFDAIERARILSGLHPGAFREISIVPGPHRNWIAKLVAALLRHVRPRLGAVTWLSRHLPPHLELLLAHEGEPLALWPFDLRAR